MEIKHNLAVLMADGMVRNLFIPPDTVKRINASFNASWNPFTRPYTPEETAEAIQHADFCITGWGCTSFTEAVIAKAERLKMVIHTGGSVAELVSEALYDRGVTVISANDMYARGVAEGTIAYMLAGLRRLPFYAGMVQAGQWPKINDYSESLLDQEVGLVGFGAIARYTARMLTAFNARVYAYDPYVSDDVFREYGAERINSVDNLCARVKILSLHMPKTKETYRMIDRKQLRLLPDGALLINTARGSVINEEALAGELKSGRIRAVLDVFDKEPLPAESGLRGLDNVILMPHMAGPAKDRWPRVTGELLDEITRFNEGEPLKYIIPKEYAFAMTFDSMKFDS
jgi:phosphoglycerate dehydrogenase-like enzyme